MKASKHIFSILLSLVLVISLSGCNALLPTMGPGEYGVIFSALPRFLGGGVRDRVLRPGATKFIFPWERLYRIDTSVQSMAWGGLGQGDARDLEDYVETRALDGNEVGLAMTILYHIDENPKTLPYVIEKVGSTPESIRRIVAACATADIRTHMNILKTKDFFSPEAREHAVNQVRASLTRRLQPEGIVIDDVIYNDHRFERRLDDGTIDRSYQKQIEQTQATKQETEQEKKKVATVVAQKRQELNEVQARVNRILEEADGQKSQALLRGDSYLAVKTNEAEQIKVVGLSDVEGLRKKVAAMSGPGGRALLRLTLAEALVARNPQFVLLNSSSGKNGGLDFTKIDANELLRQAGISAAANEMAAPKPQNDIIKAPAAAAIPPISTPAPAATAIAPNPALPQNKK